MSSSDEGGCLLWIAGALVLFGLWDGLWYSRLAYRLYYSLNDNQLSIEKKPHDCDFWKAPIGEKDCHYKRVVSITEIGTSATTHAPVISYDGGKTWGNYIPDPGTKVPQNATVTSVSVTWEKVKE